MAKKNNAQVLDTIFWIFIALLGFFLLFLDTTPGHDKLEHLRFFADNVDAIEGLLLIFVSGLKLGRKIKW